MRYGKQAGEVSLYSLKVMYVFVNILRFTAKNVFFYVDSCIHNNPLALLALKCLYPSYRATYRKELGLNMRYNGDKGPA